ncbi:MAG: adenosine deaminase [Candidatus Thorarchaeota archaeon]|nr:adenosine deaminase [Candidatus Thorarchaeota archaeon]
MNTLEAIRALPKVELHVHTLGSIQPSTLLSIIKEDGKDTPYKTVEDIVKRFQYTDFTHFIEVYMEIVGYISDESHFEHITFDMLEKCSECNTRYVEASFSPRDHIQHNLDFAKMIDSINKGIDRARESFGIETNIRIDLVRSSTQDETMEVLDHIAKNPYNIVSVDIGGNETRFPPAPFAEAFERAREMGLHLVAHAGEAAGPQSIWDAIEILKVERIGHGVSAREDPRLIALLKENRIGIEMNPISNVRTGVVKSIQDHPIREFYDKGLLVTVNSDDPSLFHTDLNNEYLQIHEHLGFSVPELFQLSMNGIETAFIAEGMKKELRTSFSSEYDQIMKQIDS